MRRSTLTLAAAGAVAMLLTGCGGDDPVSRATPAAGHSPSPGVEQAAQGSGGDGGGSGGDPGPSSAGSEPTPPPGEDPPEDAPAGSDGQAEPEPPAPRETVRHGGTYWAVLWVEGSASAPLADIRQAIQERWGPVWMHGDIGCNQGAADALGVSADALAVSVHFDTETAARQFAATAELGAEPTGHARVTTYCLD